MHVEQDGTLVMLLGSCSSDVQVVSSSGETTGLGAAVESLHADVDTIMHGSQNVAEQEYAKAAAGFEAILDTARTQALETADSIQQAWDASQRAATEQTIEDASKQLSSKLRGENSQAQAAVTRGNTAIDSMLNSKFDTINQQIRLMRPTLTERVLTAAAEITGLKGKLRGKLSQFASSVSGYHDQAKDAELTVPGLLSDMEDEINERLKGVDAINQQIDEAIPSFMGKKARIWSGGCASHAHGCGWQRYCLNRVDFNYMDGAATNAGDRIRISLTGMYRSSFYAMSHARYSYIQTRTASGTRMSGGDHRDGSGWWNHGSDWGDIRSDYFAPMPSGDFYEYWTHRGTHGWGCPGSYNWHSWNPWGSHSRVQVYYLGEA